MVQIFGFLNQRIFGISPRGYATTVYPYYRRYADAESARLKTPSNNDPGSTISPFRRLWDADQKEVNRQIVAKTLLFRGDNDLWQYPFLAGHYRDAYGHSFSVTYLSPRTREESENVRLWLNCRLRIAAINVHGTADHQLQHEHELRSAPDSAEQLSHQTEGCYPVEVTYVPLGWVHDVGGRASARD